MNTINQVSFENTYESSIIFQSFSYASIPAEVLCSYQLKRVVKCSSHYVAIIYLRKKACMVVYLNKHETSLPKAALYHVLLKISTIISPLRKEWFFLYKKMNSFTLGCFEQSLFEIVPVVLEEQVNNRRQCIFTMSFYSILRKGCCPSFA